LSDAARGAAQSSVSFTEAVNADLKMSEPPPQGRSGAPEHSPPTGPEEVDGNQRSTAPPQPQPVVMECGLQPESPTAIDLEFQAQAWVILPDLAKDLNNLKRSAIVEGMAAIKSQASKSSEEGTKNHQEDMELQVELRHSRIPASKKGKAVQKEQSIHGGQAARC
jgi:hypothetical protein